MRFLRFRQPPIAPQDIAIAFLALGLSACAAGSPASYSPAPPDPMTASHLNEKAGVVAWNQMLVRQRLPGAGCFEADYPHVAWLQVACSAPPIHAAPNAASSDVSPDAGGNHHGGTFKIYTAPLHMSGAIGNFPDVSGVKRVRSVGGNGYLGIGSYGLQLNTDYFTVVANLVSFMVHVVLPTSADCTTKRCCSSYLLRSGATERPLTFTTGVWVKRFHAFGEKVAG